MPHPPDTHVLRARATALVRAATTGDGSPAVRAQLSAAAAELSELTADHLRNARRHALPGLPPDDAVRAVAQLHDLQVAADAVGDAAAVLVSAGLSGDDRGEAVAALARRVAALAAALPSYREAWVSPTSPPRDTLPGPALRTPERP